MNVLIVHAHPEPKSFCSAMAAAAAEELSRQGHQIQLSDLYAMEFNPVASAADFGARVDSDYCVYALEQRNALRTNTLAPDIRRELDKLLHCDLLILNFPIFWFSTPAILKGWIDRVLVSGIVYGGKRFYDRGGLSGKRALVNVTMGGQEHMFNDDGVHGPLAGMLRHLLQGTLAYTGMEVLPLHVGWHVPYVSDAQRRQLMESWRTRLQTLGEATPLRFPSLDDFDESLRLRCSLRSERIAKKNSDGVFDQER